MTIETKDQIEALKKLRAEFEPNQISKLPKPTKKENPKGHCKECGGYHGLPAMHLDYVGHAALTHRLLDVDPLWTWEPVATDEKGLPALDKDGGLWIRLTVAGVTRLGYGDAQGKTGPDATKERIGDALRNAGMRFGCALDLWHKGVLELEPERFDPDPSPTAVVERVPIAGKAFQKAMDAIRDGSYTTKELRAFYTFTPDQETALADLEKEKK